MGLETTIRAAIPVLIASAIANATAGAGTIWIEGEAATKRAVVKHPWYDAVDKSGMSGGDWLSHYDAKSPGRAAYEFQVDEPGSYTFWWRGNPFKSTVSYKLNGGTPSTIDVADKRGEVMVSEKPDHRFLAWVKVGKVDLVRGKNSIVFLIQSELSNQGGIDCFAFDNTGFLPSGSRKPGPAGPPPGPGEWFPAVFDDDPFSADSVIDLSRLTEAPAGNLGFLRPSGDSLKFEKSADPVRFWAAGANLGNKETSRDQLTRRARYLRKHGVNMVRQHTVVDEVGMPGPDGNLDPGRLDRFDWWCAELKRNGIYMTWSVFYRTRVSAADGYDPELFRELDVLDAGRGVRDGYGLVNVEPGLQELQLRMLKALLLHRNKYTGLRPVDDPALAVLEFQNEDDVFFYFPLSDLASGKKWPAHSRRLRHRFFEWAMARHASREELIRAWGEPVPGDDFEKGELQLMAAHHLGGAGPLYEMTGKTARAGDQIRFLTELQRGFYERREKEVRALGFRAVTVTTAWRSGGAAADPANLYCDSAAEMIDRHNYFGGGAGGHGVAEGTVHNESHLATPGRGLLSIGLYQVEGRPFACTEWTQMPPNMWKVEAAPLMAFYGMGLQGWDASYHFTSEHARPGDGWPDRHSYVTDTPHFIGQFPALAFAVRKGHVTPAPVVAARRLKVDDLFSGVDPLAQDFTGGGLDAKALKGELATPPEALAVGRVTVGFSGGKGEAIDLARYWDKNAKVIRSITGELIWDYGRQVVTVRTPKTQAILGHARGSTISLPGATVSAIKTPFVSLILTPLDDLPLAESRRLLVTAMARDAQTGARYSDDGKALLKVGDPPLLMEPVQATIALKGQPPKAVNVLDLYGVPTGKKVPTGKDGAFAIGGQYRTYYYEIQR